MSDVNPKCCRRTQEMLWNGQCLSGGMCCAEGYKFEPRSGQNRTLLQYIEQLVGTISPPIPPNHSIHFTPTKYFFFLQSEDEEGSSNQRRQWALTASSPYPGILLWCSGALRSILCQSTPIPANCLTASLLSGWHHWATWLLSTDASRSGSFLPGIWNDHPWLSLAFPFQCVETSKRDHRALPEVWSVRKTHEFW